jgi:hypothetical protein
MAFDWPDAASRLLKAEIAREGVTLAHLAARLTALGTRETEASLKNKLYRGTFSMTFFMQAVRALGGASVDLSSVVSPDVPRGSDLDKTESSKG